MPAVVVPTAVLVEALAAVAAAGSRLEVAEAALPVLLEQPGVRAAAVVQRVGADVVVQGSAGYECATMAPGSRLPLDAGLPVTEAVRTDRTVVRGPGPSWVAAPFRRRGTGALLLSLHSAPPEDLAPVVALAHVLGAALERVARTELALAEVTLVTASAVAEPEHDPALDVVTRSVPLAGPVGGDVLLSLRSDRGGSWLLVADVCGSGLAAALVGRSVAVAARALAPFCAGPADLLHELERSVRPFVGPDSFVTAVVVHLGAQGTTVGSAGHPPPLLLTAGGAAAVPVPIGPPLALATGRTEAYAELTLHPPADAVLLLHTDGLVDRHGARSSDPRSLVRGVRLDDLSVLADQVLAAAERTGPATDDAAVMLVRPRSPGRGASGR